MSPGWELGFQARCSRGSEGHEQGCDVTELHLRVPRGSGDVGGRVAVYTRDTSALSGGESLTRVAGELGDGQWSDSRLPLE